MKWLLGWVLLLWCPSVVVVSLFMKSYRRLFLLSGMAVGGLFTGVVLLFLGLKKVRDEPSEFQLLGFLRKGFKSSKWEEYTGYDIIALGVLAFLAAGTFVAAYFW